MATTFLDLVNGAVEETKVTLDLLTSSDFAAPIGTTMYNRFKRWVNMAYKELLLERPEWYFRRERAVVSVWPRIHVAGLTSIPAVGDHLVGQSSGTELLVKEVFDFEETVNAANTERTLSVEVVTGDLRNLILRELFDIEGGATGIGYLKGMGTYDFRSMVSNLQGVDLKNMVITKTAQNSVDEGSAFATDSAELNVLDWTRWLTLDRPSPWDGTTPCYITEMGNGTYQLYPQPTEEMYLTFDYIRSIPVMTAWNDVPDGIPEEFQDYLMWRAVQEYGDFEKNSAVYLRATKHVEKYIYWMSRDNLPELKIGEY
jgi:hypothetical protein